MPKTHQKQSGGSQAFWQKHINAWEQYSRSQREYCKYNVLRLSASGYWRRKLAGRGVATDLVKIQVAVQQT